MKTCLSGNQIKANQKALDYYGHCGSLYFCGLRLYVHHFGIFKFNRNEIYHAKISARVPVGFRNKLK